MKRSTMLAAVSIGVVVLYALAVLVEGETPGVNDDGGTVVAWLLEHRDQVRWATWFITLAAPVFAVYAVLMRELLTGIAGRLFMFGATAVVVLSTMDSWFIAGLARRPELLDPNTVRTLFDISNYWGPTLTGFTVLTLGPLAWAGLRGGQLPRWVGVLAAVTFVEQIIETVTIFGTSGFIAAGGPMNTQLGAGLTILTWLVAGITASRRMPATTGSGGRTRGRR